MTTTMLDALSDEANEITTLGKQAALIVQSMLARAAALGQQLDVLGADGVRLVGGDVELISSNSTVEEFAAFQARHFPYRALQPEAPLGIHPAAQDDGQGNQGSAEANATPPGAPMVLQPSDARESGEAEQVVAEAVSEERAVSRVEPETAPDHSEAVTSTKERFLDLWAGNLWGVTAIAKHLGCPPASAANYLVQARRDGDPRAARGDLSRADEAQKIEAEANQKPAAKPYDPPAADVEEPKDRKPGQILILDPHPRNVHLDGKVITLPKHDYRIVQALNDGMPTGIEPLLTAASVLTAKRLNALVESLSARLKVIGVEIVITDGPLYTLTHL
jgi:hypothetical protein